MTRTIKMRIFRGDLPADAHGAAMQRDTNDYQILINQHDSRQRQAACFLHECLHIWHNDFESTKSAGQIEAERHAEMVELLELLTREQ